MPKHPKPIIEDEGQFSSSKLIFHIDNPTNPDTSRTTTRISTQTTQTTQSPTPGDFNNDGGNTDSRHFARVASNFTRSQIGSNTQDDDNEFDDNIDNDLALDQFDEQSTNKQPQRFQFPRTQSNVSGASGGGVNGQLTLQRTNSMLSSGTDVVHIHGDFEESMEFSRNDSDDDNGGNHNNGVASPRQQSINIYSTGSTVPFTTIIGGKTNSSVQNITGPSPSDTIGNKDDYKKNLPPPPRQQATIVPLTQQNINTPQSLPSQQNSDESSQPSLNTTTAIPSSTIDAMVATNTTIASIPVDKMAEDDDLFPGDGQHTFNNLHNNNNHYHYGDQPIGSDDIEQNNKKSKAITLSSEDIEGLDIDDINNQLHNKYLPDWCSCFVSSYLHSSTIRRHAFQRPLDDRQIMVIVILLLSFFLSIIVWFVAEPVVVARVAFGVLWLLLVATILLMWMFISFIETRAYKLSNIPNNLEDLYQLDKRLLEHGKAQMIEIKKKNQELLQKHEKNDKTNNNSSRFDSFANPPGTHHELAGFVPVRDTMHDYMTDTRFCCFLFKSRGFAQHRAMTRYTQERGIQQQKVPFWVKPYSFYLKLYGDMKTTVQYLRQHQHEDDLNGTFCDRNSSSHRPNQPQNSFSSPQHGSFSAQAVTTTGNQQYSSSNLNNYTRRQSNVSQTPHGYNQVRSSSIAPSVTHGNDQLSQYGGDLTDSQSVISTLSVVRKQQLLISSNQFNITHNTPITFDDYQTQLVNPPSQPVAVGVGSTGTITPLKVPPRGINIHSGTPRINGSTLSPLTNIPNSNSNQRDSMGALRDSEGNGDYNAGMNNNNNNNNNNNINNSINNNNNNNNPKNPTNKSLHLNDSPSLSQDQDASPQPRFPAFSTPVVERISGGVRSSSGGSGGSRGRTLVRNQSSLEHSFEDNTQFDPPDTINDEENNYDRDTGEFDDGEDKLKKIQFGGHFGGNSNNKYQDYDLSDGDEDGRVSTIQPLVSITQYNFLSNNHPNHSNNNSPHSSTRGFSSSNSSNAHGPQRSHSSTPGHNRVKSRPKHNTLGPVGGVGLNNTTDSPGNTVGDDSISFGASSPDRRRGYSTIQPGDFHNSPQNHSNSLQNGPETPSHSTSTHNINTLERGTLTQLKQRSNSGFMRQNTMNTVKFDSSTLPGVPTVLNDLSMADDTISIATNHNITVLKSVHDVAERTGQVKPSVVDIVQTHELPIGTGTYQYEDVIIDTQQQLVPIEPTTWWPHHLLSLYELYQLTDVYYTPPSSMRTQYNEIISEYEKNRLQTFSNNFKFTNLSAAEEHVFVGVSNKIRLNSRSGLHGSIGGERGYHNDEVCVMQEGELRMSYFNHFNNIISLPFHAGYFGNASFPAIPDVETPIPVFGVGIKESRPLQATLQKKAQMSNAIATGTQSLPNTTKTPNNNTNDGLTTVVDTQNVTTIVVVDDVRDTNANASNVPSPLSVSSSSFVLTNINKDTDNDKRGRGLHYEPSFSQYSFVHKKERGQSMQPIAVHTHTPHLHHHRDTVPLDLDTPTHSPQNNQKRTQPSFLLATESFIRDGSTLMIGNQAIKRQPQSVQNGHNGQNAQNGQHGQNNNNNQSFDPNTLPRLTLVGSDNNDHTPKTTTLTHAMSHHASKLAQVQQQTVALTYIHPNQVTAQLHTKTLNTTATTQQRLYINTKRGPLVCIDEPHHCQTHDNDRGMIVASSKCVVDFDRRPIVCKQCRIFQEKTMLHCTICNKCTEYFDHHCPYLNICVGERNYHVFYTLVLAVTLFTILNFFLSIRMLLLSFDIDIFGEIKSPLLSSGHYYEGHIFGSAYVGLAIVSALAIIINLVGIGAFGSLFSVHTYLIYHRTTTRALLQRWKEEKKQKRRAERKREEELEQIRLRREEKKKEEEELARQLEERKMNFHPKFKPTKNGISLSVKFNIDTEADVASLDQFRTQPRRQTIYHRKVSGVVPITQPIPQYDEDGNVIVIAEEDEDNKDEEVIPQQTKPKGSIFNKGRGVNTKI